MGDRFSDPGWWPTPPPKPLKAPSAAKLVLGILPGIAVVGAVVALSTIGHSGHKAKPKATAVAATSGGATAQSRRQAFADCMRSMGAGAGFGGGGRFGGGGPSKDFRTAFEVCRSLVSRGAPAPTPPAPPTRTTAVPVA